MNKDVFNFFSSLLFTVLFFVLIIYLIWNNSVFGVDFSSIKLPFSS
jgi:hypothetical protein